MEMKSEKEKDALTDLTEIAVSSDVLNQSSNNGEVTDSSGDKITLGFSLLIEKIRDNFRRKKKEEEEVLEYLIKKQDRQ